MCSVWIIPYSYNNSKSHTVWITSTKILAALFRKHAFWHFEWEFLRKLLIHNVLNHCCIVDWSNVGVTLQNDCDDTVTYRTIHLLWIETKDQIEAPRAKPLDNLFHVLRFLTVLTFYMRHAYPVGPYKIGSAGNPRGALRPIPADCEARRMLDSDSIPPLP